MEHVVFNSDQQGSNRQWRNCFLHDRIVLFYSYMNSSGVFENYAAQYTSEGIQILAEGHSENIPRFLGTVTASEYVGGDPAVLYNLDDSGFGTVLYRFTETGLEPIGDTAGLGLGTLASCDMAGAYLTGDILQVYRPVSYTHLVKAVIIYDEDPEATELIMMSADGTALTSAFISGKDGAALAEAAKAAIAGGAYVKLTVHKDDEVVSSPEGGKMSSFSSWGCLLYTSERRSNARTRARSSIIPKGFGT